MRQIFNPFLPLEEYIPDGEPHVFDKRVYLFGSHDKEGGETFCILDYVLYSAPVNNVRDWRYEGVIYRSIQDPNADPRRRYMYAPDVVRGNDGRYYLYYCLSGKGGKGGFEGPISVAVSDTPAGRYEYYGDVKNRDGTIFRRMIPFDPAVINDDGTIRLYYGWALPVGKPKTRLEAIVINAVMKRMFLKSVEEIVSEQEGIMGANTVEVASDMLTVITEPKRILPPPAMAEGTDFEGHAFFEGSSIRKIGDNYYFIYSSQRNHELCYARSKFPDRGFVYGGTIISGGDVGYHGRKEKERLNTTSNNHGSIECIDGSWYVFYHRHTHNSSYSRQACAEKIMLKEDGTISQVEMTSCGLNGEPLTGHGIYPAVIACNLTDGRMRHLRNGKANRKKPCIKYNGEERVIDGIRNGTLIGYKYFDFQGKTKMSVKVKGGGKGKFILYTEINGTKVGEITVSRSKKWTDFSTQVEIYGAKALYISFEGRGSFEFLSFTLF